MNLKIIIKVVDENMALVYQDTVKVPFTVIGACQEAKRMVNALRKRIMRVKK